jgi:hypothetical protein
MVPFVEKDSKVTLGCSHTFHYGCLLQWNLASREANHKACPLCRENVGIDETLTNIGASLIAPPSLNERQIIPHDHVSPDDLILNPDHGLAVRCLDCDSDFYQCDGCGINICSCPFSLDMRDWEGRRFHCPRNPFDEPVNEAELEEGEIPETYCCRCFVNREERVLDFMMDDHGDIDIFYHENMIEMYENFFNDKSGRDNTQIYARYPKYTFDEFKDHMEQIFQDEMSSGDNIIDLIDEDIYGEGFDVDSIEPTFPPENQAGPALESVPVPSAPPPLINLDELEEFIEEENPQIFRREIHIQLPQIDNISPAEAEPVVELNELMESDGGDWPEIPNRIDVNVNVFHNENYRADDRIRYLLRYMNNDARNLDFINNTITETETGRDLIIRSNRLFNRHEHITQRTP